MNQDPLICIVDDDHAMREGAASLIRAAGMRVETHPSAAALLERRQPERPGCLILEVRLPGMSGIELEQELARSDGQVPVIFVTASGEIATSVRAMKGGAHELLTKPFDGDEWLASVHSAIARGAAPSCSAPKPVADRRLDNIVGSCPSLQTVLRQVRTVAGTDSTVLISGETGTGKELIARALHDLSAQRNGPFVKVNCAAIPAGLLESELMGHEKGAFTGACPLKACPANCSAAAPTWRRPNCRSPPATPACRWRASSSCPRSGWPHRPARCSTLCSPIRIRSGP